MDGLYQELPSLYICTSDADFYLQMQLRVNQ